MRIFTRNHRDMRFLRWRHMITNNSNNYHVFLNVFMFRIMSVTLRNINPQKEIFHHYDFPVYTTSKYRDPKLDTYRRITHNPFPVIFGRYVGLRIKSNEYDHEVIEWCMESSNIKRYVFKFQYRFELAIEVPRYRISCPSNRSKQIKETHTTQRRHTLYAAKFEWKITYVAS